MAVKPMAVIGERPPADLLHNLKSKLMEKGFLKPYLEPLLGEWLYSDSLAWTAIGFAGAAIFGSRFFFQWLHSEKEKQLVVPWYFWHLSFWGSCLNFVYCMHLDKAPLIVGNIMLPILYGRNLVLMYRGKERTLRGS